MTDDVSDIADIVMEDYIANGCVACQVSSEPSEHLHNVDQNKICSVFEILQGKLNLLFDINRCHFATHIIFNTHHQLDFFSLRVNELGKEPLVRIRSMRSGDPREREEILGKILRRTVEPNSASEG